MKKIIFVRLLGLFVTVIIILSGCGGGGGSSTGTQQTPTAPGTVVNLSILDALITGTATSGTQTSFNLSGSDNTGRAYTGTFQIISDGTTIFNAQTMTSSRILTTVTSTGVAAVSNIQTSYYLLTGDLFQITDSLTGTTSIPTSQSKIPSTSTVGASSALYNLTATDGTTESVSWRINGDFNGNSIFIISSIIKNNVGNVVSTEDDSLFMDTSGNIYAIKMTITSNGVTATLSGNKI